MNQQTVIMLNLSSGGKYRTKLLPLATSLKPKMNIQLDGFDQIMLEAFMQSAIKSGLTEDEANAFNEYFSDKIGVSIRLCKTKSELSKD